MAAIGSDRQAEMAIKLLVTGREGQIAQALARCADERFVTVCVGRPYLYLARPETILAALAEYRPDIVVNPAAYTAVDKAESESDLAFAINRDGAGRVAAAAAESGVPIIHISTDYVFAGDKPSPYVETDPADPQGVDGASKLAGERAVAAANPRMPFCARLGSTTSGATTSPRPCCGSPATGTRCALSSTSTARRPTRPTSRRAFWRSLAR